MLLIIIITFSYYISMMLTCSNVCCESPVFNVRISTLCFDPDGSIDFGGEYQAPPPT